jgi:hypothetical protein
LRPGESLSVAGVSTNNVLKITLAAGELVVSVGGGHVVGASNEIVDVLAVVRGGDCGVAEFDAEGSTADEVVPLDSLELCGVVLSTRETGRVYESTERVSGQVSTVRVKFSSGVVHLETETGVVDVPSDLNVGTCPHELGASDGTFRNNTGTVA